MNVEMYEIQYVSKYETFELHSSHNISFKAITDNEKTMSFRLTCKHTLILVLRHTLILRIVESLVEDFE